MEGGTSGGGLAEGSITRPLFQQQDRRTASARDTPSPLPPSSLPSSSSSSASSFQAGGHESGLLSATQALQQHGGGAEIV